MAKKIEGWVSKDAFTDPCNAGCSFGENMRPLLADQKATLVIGDERVFTESEVRAMLEDVAHCITWPEAKGVLRRKYSIVLDPA